MRGKFVWADGYIKTAEGFENTKQRPLHHRYLIEALVDEGKIDWPAKNCLCGWYNFDPLHPEIINGREGAKWGVTPTLDECLQMIKADKPKLAKRDWAATLEYLSAEYSEAEGEEMLRIIRETGGGTFLKRATNSYEPLYLTQGYYVSEAGKEQVIPLVAASPEKLLDYANASVPTGEMFGTWVDGGDLYLDCSHYFHDYNEALAFGQVNAQQAIWDAGNNQEIRLDDAVTSDTALPAKWAWVENWVDDGEVLAKTAEQIQLFDDINFYQLYPDPERESVDYDEDGLPLYLENLFLKYFWDEQSHTLYYWKTIGVDGDPIHSQGFQKFWQVTGEKMDWSMADKWEDRFAWGLEAREGFVAPELSFKNPHGETYFYIYGNHGNAETKQHALEAVKAFVYGQVTAATSEDTEPVGKQVGFIQDPHEELYPCLFRGEDSIPSEVIETLKNHVLEPLSERFTEPDSWIMFSIYGSGISYNWDESGDMDIQMWVDIDEFLRYNFDEDMDQDELISEVRKIVQQVNFPAFKSLGLTYEDCEGNMLIQYYPKPGTGSKEENLASKPYACYDMDKGIWLQKPIVLKPKFYGETFLLLMPKAEEIAKQAEALLADYKRDILNWEFWDLLYRKNKKKEFKEQRDQTVEDAEQRRDGIINMFEGIFGGRAEAYSPGGRGVKDERDIMQKLLEVWGIFQDLKHYAREPMPWAIEIPEPKRSANATQYQRILDQYPGQPLQNYPGPVNVPGIGPLNFGAHSELQGLAEQYAQQKGLSGKPNDYVAVDPNLAEQIAWDYENMEDNPDDPNVQASYNAFIRETMEQYKMLVNAGYTFEFYPEGQDPYPRSPREAILDLYKNKHMYVFPTEAGYGSLNETTNHALLQDSGVKWGGKPVTYNDIFRAVHDVFGHAKEGVGFRWDGEENAWRQHFYMYSPEAQPAMTAETRGQNNWVNFGPYGELKNQRANQDETIYADQKMGILPEWAMDTYARRLARRLANSSVFVPKSEVAPINGALAIASIKGIPVRDLIPHEEKDVIEIGGKRYVEIPSDFAIDIANIMEQLRTEGDPRWAYTTPWELKEEDGLMKLTASLFVRLANFNVVSADVYELAQNAWKNLAEQQFAPYIIKLDLDNMEDAKMKSDLQGINGDFMKVMTSLLQNNPETYKFFPWLWREYKFAMQKILNGTMDFKTIMPNNRNHIVDILKQATGLMEKMRTDPRPETKVPNIMADFKPGPDGDGFRKLEAWTYDNASKYQQEALENDETVFDYGNGWRIVKVHPDNLAWEGDQMGHCVGGYCDLVEKGDSIIYSLRDPKGMPHATIEVNGKFAHGPNDAFEQHQSEPVNPLTQTDENDAWEVVQIQGKENQDPKPEYKAMIRQWMDSLRQNGVQLTWAGNQWNVEAGPEIYISGANDFADWYGRGEQLPQKGELDEYGLPKVVDFTFHIDETLEGIVQALVSTDTYRGANELQQENVTDLVNAFMDLCRYYDQDFTGYPSSDYIEHEIDAAQQWLDDQMMDLRDQNWDYEWETMRAYWEYEYPGEDFLEAYNDEDPRMEKIRDEAAQAIEGEISGPYKDSRAFIEGVRKANEARMQTTGAVKTAIWKDIVEKATRYLNEGRVQMQNNMPDHSIATVNGDTGTYTTEIWRQDPSRPNTLSGWSCTCPWGEVSWGRTRIWKKYEGRPCAHTVVLSWESQKQPWDVDEQGNEQLELFDAQQQPGRSFDQFTQDIPRATPPTPGSGNLQLIEQLTLPGAFSSWRKESTEIIDLPEGLETHGWDDIRRTLVYVPTIDKMWLAPDNVYHTEIYQWIFQNDPEVYQGLYDLRNMHGIVEGNVLWAIDDDFPEEVVSALEKHLRRPLIQKGWITPRSINDDYYGGEDDYYENSFGEQPWWSWQRTTAFLNGGFVRNKIKMIGQDDRGESYMVPRNTVGEVLYSDDETTIVIFNLPSGPLGAHLIRVEETTDKFMAAPKNILDRGPAPRRRTPNA